MAGITTPELVSTVSNTQGLGSFATGYLTSEEVQLGIKQIKKQTSFPFAVNLFIPDKEKDPNLDEIKSYQGTLNRFRKQLGMPQAELPNLLSIKDEFYKIVDILLVEKIKVVSFTFGMLPQEIMTAFKNNGTYLMGTATSLEEAQALRDLGVNAIIAQGYEAGGHRGGFLTPVRASSIGIMTLVPIIKKHIDLPVIAAGGIMTAEQVLSVLILGAAAVQMGTAFLTVKESGASPVYKQALIKKSREPFDVTQQTNVYSGKMARGIQTEFMKIMENSSLPIPPYPIPHMLTSPLRKEAAKQNNPEIMSLWSGQGLPLISLTDSSAAEFLKELYANLNKLKKDILYTPFIWPT